MTPEEMLAKLAKRQADEQADADQKEADKRAANEVKFNEAVARETPPHLEWLRANGFTEQDGFVTSIERRSDYYPDQWTLWLSHPRLWRKVRTTDEQKVGQWPVYDGHRVNIYSDPLYIVQLMATPLKDRNDVCRLQNEWLEWGQLADPLEDAPDFEPYHGELKAWREEQVARITKEREEQIKRAAEAIEAIKVCKQAEDERKAQEHEAAVKAYCEATRCPQVVLFPAPGRCECDPRCAEFDEANACCGRRSLRLLTERIAVALENRASREGEE